MSDRDGYTYRFTDGWVYECDLCGALVSRLGIDKHNHFHGTFNVLTSISGGVA